MGRNSIQPSGYFHYSKLALWFHRFSNDQASVIANLVRCGHSGVIVDDAKRHHAWSKQSSRPRPTHQPRPGLANFRIRSHMPEEHDLHGSNFFDLNLQKISVVWRMKALHVFKMRAGW